MVILIQDITNVILLLLLLSSSSCTRSSRRKIRFEAWNGAGCPPPDLALNTTVRGAAVDMHRTDYAEVTEVKFSGRIGPLGERRLCKIKCIGGEWVGPLCQSHDDGGRYHPLFRSCRLDHLPAHLMVTYRNVTIPTDRVSFPHGATVLLRCRQLGVYKLLGESSLTCQNGGWSSRVPACIPTTMITNFTEDAPPTVLVKIPSGSASVEPSGELAVFPGTILHLECLYSRRLGNPEWTWTSTFRQYLTGWAIATEEREWKYRLSIYYSKPQDSGVYTCATPRGLTNSVTIHVAAVHCAPMVVSDPHLTTRLEGSRLGHVAVFQCPVGFRLNGTSNLTCQASGQWSAAVPHCSPITCPPLDVGAVGEVEGGHLRLLEHNSSYGGRALFSCAWGFTLRGAPGIECDVDGTWSGSPPTCVPVECPPPMAPMHGRLLEDGTRYHRVGAAVQFVCNDHHLLVGESTVVCTEGGQWSHPPPLCQPRCPYPGDPPHGHVAPIKFSYEPGDRLQVTCAAGYVVRVDARPLCKGDGTWSEGVPLCTSYQDV